MEDVSLNKYEKKILALLQKYPYRNIGLNELYAYFHFPEAEPIMMAVKRLKDKDFIGDQEKPLHGFCLRPLGAEYLATHRFSLSRIMPNSQSIILAIISAAIAAIVSKIIE